MHKSHIKFSYIMIFVWVSVLLFYPLKALSQGSEIEYKDLKISLSTHGNNCHAGIPGGPSQMDTCIFYEIVITGDGNVDVRETTTTGKTTHKQFAIPLKQVDEIVKEFNKINFFSLPDQYDGAAGSPTWDISITLNGKTKTVIDSRWHTPVNLQQLENKILNIVLDLVKN